MQICYKRVAVCYFLVVVMLLVCILRIFAIATNEEYSQVAQNESRRVITVGKSRGTIYDCKMNKLTNERIEYYTLFFNEQTALASLYSWFSGEETKEITDEILEKGFALRKLNRKLSGDGIYSFPVSVVADDSTLCKHTIGYINSEGNGVCGIEAAFNDVLKSESENILSFAINGRGERLYGEEPTFSYDYSTEISGVKLTIDREIQQIAEQASISIKKGAVIVTEIESGKIRAMVSRPDYKLSDLSKALTDESKPLLNRVISTYNIGSVFKPAVAAAGIEANVNFSANCVGYTNVDGLTFACHKYGGHGEVGLYEALKFSCNSYFYQFIQRIGAERVEKIAKSAGLLNDIYLAKGIVCTKGNIGNKTLLKSSQRALANLSIGQGELLVSPLAITQLYMAIANKGVYRPVSLVEAVVKGSKTEELNLKRAKISVMSENTANIIKNALAQVLSEGGTGEKAKPTLTTAAGKTGTAQTGIIKNGKKVTNSLFCGFFPLENPKYAVTVLSEDSASGCGGVFAAIADSITDLQGLVN